MRIVSGTHKGRKIQMPNNLAVRPTTDRAKESLFNILQNRYVLENKYVLDLFAGSGNISYEFFSIANIILFILFSLLRIIKSFVKNGIDPSMSIFKKSTFTILWLTKISCSL